MFPSGENAGFPAAAVPRAPSGRADAGEERLAGAPRPSPEGAAWAEVLAAWGDEARHRAYLARFTDLDGLAVAGRRYREALALRPGDPLAGRFRDEVVRRALAQGLAALPRPPSARGGRGALRLAAVALLSALAVSALFVAGAQLGAGP